MKITIKCKSRNNAKYRGLYRAGPFPDNEKIEHIYRNNEYAYKMWDYYVNSEHNGLIDLTEPNLAMVTKLYKEADLHHEDCDLMLFSDDPFDAATNAEFIGYDVCGDSMHFSYLGDTTFAPNNASKYTYFQILVDSFRPRLNEHGLFIDIEQAHKFAKVLSELAEYGLVENENRWRPVKMFILKLNSGVLLQE